MEQKEVATLLLKSQHMSDCSAFGHRKQLITYCFTRGFVTRFCKHIAPHCQIANLRIPAKTDTPLWVTQIFHSGQCFFEKVPREGPTSVHSGRYSGKTTLFFKTDPTVPTRTPESSMFVQFVVGNWNFL